MPETEPKYFNHEVYSGVNVITALADVAMDRESAPAYRTVFIDLSTDPECTSVVLDITRAHLLDTSHLAVIVGAQKRLQANSKNFIVDYAGNKHVEDTFKMTGLIRIFELMEAQTSSLESPL